MHPLGQTARITSLLRIYLRYGDIWASPNCYELLPTPRRFIMDHVKD